MEARKGHCGAGGGSTFSVEGDVCGHMIGGGVDLPVALDARRRGKTLEKEARRFW